MAIGPDHETSDADRSGEDCGLATWCCRKVEDALLRRVPEKYLRHAHHWLILHGRYVCKARKPDCTACAVADVCRYKAKVTA